MGSSSLNIDGVSKRAIYSESVNKMLQHASSLNMRRIFIKVIYSESGKHILQLGSEIFDFHDILFQT